MQLSVPLQNALPRYWNCNFFTISNSNILLQVGSVGSVLVLFETEKTNDWKPLNILKTSFFIYHHVF